MRDSANKLLKLGLVAALVATAGFVVWTLVRPDGGSGSGEKAESRLAGGDQKASGGELSGFVLDGESDLGIPSGRIQVVCAGKELTGRSDAGGSFVIPGLAGGSCVVTAGAEGYVASPRHKEASEEFQMSSGQSIEDIELRLYKTCKVSGEVTAEKKPVSGVRLSILYLEAPAESRALNIDTDILTDPAGAYQVDGLSPGRIRVLAEEEGFALAESRELFLKNGAEISGVDIELSSAGAVAGSAVKPDGSFVPDVEVRLLSAGTHGPRKTTTDTSGRFRIEGVAPGPFQISARAPGYAPVRMQAGEVESGGVAEVKLVMRPVDGVGGRVEDRNGNPVAGAAVFLRAPDAERPASPVAHSDPAGSFFLSGPFDSSRFVVWATHPAHGPSAEVPTDLGVETPLVLTLTGPGSLTGLVAAATDGTPLKSFSVRVAAFRERNGPLSSGGGFQRRSFLDPEGRFTLPALTPGEFTIEVLARGFTPALVEGIEVIAGQRTDAGVIRLETAGAIIGRVTDDHSGQPLAGARVSAMMPGMGSAGVGTDAQGAFRLTRIPAERTTLTISKRGYVAEMLSGVSPPSGGTTDVGEIRLQPAGEKDKNRFRYTGVGIVLQGDREGKMWVRELLEDGPAGAAGIGKGAEILTVNGYDVAVLGLQRVVEMIRGEPGTQVILEVLTPGSAYPQTIPIERSRLTHTSRR